MTVFDASNCSTGSLAKQRIELERICLRGTLLSSSFFDLAPTLLGNDISLMSVDELTASLCNVYQGITELYEKKSFNFTQSYFTALCGVRYSLLILLTVGSTDNYENVWLP